MADVDFELPSDPQRKVWDSAFLTTGKTSLHALIFSVFEQNFAIAADFIEQIVELPAFASVPSSGATLLGLADHAGRPIPVVDFSPLLNDESRNANEFRHGLLLNHNGLRVMLAIESVVVLKELSGKSGVELPPEYRTCGIVDYACEIPIIDSYPIPVSQTETQARSSSSGLQPIAEGQSSKLVIVLDVPRLMTAIQNAAYVRPDS